MKTGVPDMNAWRFTRVSAVAAVSLAAAACSQQPRLAATSAIQPVSFTAQDRECMARAMYFESHRGADEGMVAVGTVVANRKDSGRWGSTVCEVVGQKRQFAPGVMTRTMDGEAAERARRNAEKVLSGQRHPALKTAMFFHTAGYKFRYPNMHYVLVAGGNAFYDKTKPPKTWYGGEGRWGPPPAPDERVDGVMVAKVDIIHDEPQPEVRTVAAAPRRAEVQVADARPARAEGGAYGGVPTYEPLPGQRSARVRETQVAALERPIPARPVARAQIQEDNGLREEDRWRDQELAEDAGRQPASDVDWRERRDSGVESAPLPVIETRPDPAPRRQTRVASRDDYGYGAPAPQAEAYEPRPAPARRQVSARQQPVAADPAAMGWHAGPQPVRMGEGYDAAPAPQGGSQGEMDGYQPLSRVGEEAMSAPPVRRAPARSAQRSYGGATLEQDRYGYR